MEETFEGGGYKLEDRGQRWIESYVRLKPGVTREQAQGEISAIATRLEANYPATNRGRSITLWPLWQTPFNNAGTLLPTLEIMLAVVAFVLLIACANVGNLLLVRSFARRREMTVRLAIGASRARLLQQLFTEGLILATIGAACGLLVAYWCRHALVLLLPTRSGVPMYLPGEIDWRVMSLSAGICLIATLIVGLVPALQTRNLDLAGALKAESTGVVSARWNSVGAIEPGRFPGLSEFCSTGWRGTAAAKPRKDSHHQPRFLNHQCCADRRVFGRCWIRRAPGQDLSAGVDRSRPGAAGRQSAAFARVTPLGYG